MHHEKRGFSEEEKKGWTKGSAPFEGRADLSDLVGQGCLPFFFCRVERGARLVGIGANPARGKEGEKEEEGSCPWGDVQ